MTAIEPQQQELELQGVEFTDVGATIVGPVDVAQVAVRLSRLASSESWTRWVVGDLFLAIVAAHDGDRAPAYVAVAGAGFTAAWLNQAVAVSERVPVHLRRASLSWGHHRVVAVDGVDAAVQDRMLGAAVAGGWTVRQLEEAVARWLRRDQAVLDVGDDETAPVPRLPRRVVAAMFEAAGLSPSGWVSVHPASGRVRAISEGGERRG